jgi:hypothetical protein
MCWFADDINLLSENLCSINRNVETSKEDVSEINTKKIQCIAMFHHQNVGQNHNIR